MILNGNHTPTNTEGPTGITIPTDPAVFKTAWWLGSATDNNMGTVAYPAMDKIAPGMTPDGWADEGWFRLLQVVPSLFVLCFAFCNPSSWHRSCANVTLTGLLTLALLAGWAEPPT